MVARVPAFAAVLAAMLFVSCKARQAPQAEAELKDLNPGRPMSQDEALMDSPDLRKKKVVLIYYSNDTYAPTDDDVAHLNKEALIGKLRSGQTSPKLSDSQKGRLRQVATRVADDWNGFRRVVDKDLSYLTQAICKPNPRYQMGLIVFRNFGNDASAVKNPDQPYDYERTLNYDYCMPSTRAQKGTYAVPNFDDFRFQSQPLANPFVFRKAIDEVMKNFPMGEYRYVLITKSHGSKEMAVAPHLSVDVRNVPDEDVWAAVLGNATDRTGLDADKMDNPILDGDKMDNPILDEIDTVLMKNQDILRKAAVAQQVGISKKDYLTTLQKVGGGDPKLGMYFPLVFMESCKSGLELASNGDIKERLTAFDGSYVGFNMQNVGLLYTSDQKGLGYRTIDFKQIFEGFKFNDKRDFQDALRSFLDGVATAPAR